MAEVGSLGGEEKTCKWLLSFLSNRSQLVRIGNQVSDLVTLQLGCPQGSVLSPLLYTIYTADLEYWLDEHSAILYADDATAVAVGRNDEESIQQLEIIANKYLRYTASNFLKANEAKTVFMLVRSDGKENMMTRSLQVGSNTVPESYKMVFLGVTICNNLSWLEHSKNVASEMRKTYGLLSRLAANVPRKQLLPIIHGLVMSKVRYCIAAYGTVRMNDIDPMNGLMKEIQKELNRGMRLVTGTKMIDRISINELIEMTGVPSVNHVTAETMLREIWRSKNLNLPLMDYLPPVDSMRIRATRSEGQGLIKAVKNNNYAISLAKLWNALPQEARVATEQREAFSIIKDFVKMLPIV